MGKSLDNCGCSGMNDTGFNVGMGECNNGMPVKFDSMYNPGSAATIITLDGTSGVLNQTQATLLAKNVNSVIKLGSNYYRIQLKNRNEWLFATVDTDTTSRKLITIDVPEFTWEFTVIQEPSVEQHAADTNLHIQPGERDFWNNKLNYTIDSEDPEHLILNRN